MKLKKLSILGAIVSAVAATVILLVTYYGDEYTFEVENLTTKMKTDIFYKIEKREYIYIDTHALKVGETKAIDPGSDEIVAYYGDQTRTISESNVELAWRGMSDENRVNEIMGYDSLYSFNALVTGYGPDCRGCSGVTATGHNAIESIYYNDPEFGNIRIVAVDAAKFKYGSVFRITNYRDWEPFLVIALDCGSAIRGNDLDLLYSSETLGNDILGLDKNVNADMIRRGY